jgi:hypothetical protein
MSSVLSTTANLNRSDLLVLVKANPPVYAVTGVATGGTVTFPVGTVLRNLGKKVVTPAQGSAAAGDSQVSLLKVIPVVSADNDAVGDGDATTGPFYVNLRDGYVARV